MRWMTFTLTLTLAALTAGSAHGQIAYSLGTYTQNFNSLSSTGNSNPWVNNSTIPGWYATQSTYQASDGTGNTGALYSFGVGGAGPVTDRALGSIASGNTGTVRYAMQLRNDSGSPISEVLVSYWGEQWRNGGSTFLNVLSVDYQVTSDSSATPFLSGTYIAVPALTFASPQQGGSPGPLDGNAAANRVFLTTTINVGTWNPGQYLWIRWTDLDDTGNDNGLAIDDVSFAVIPEPHTMVSLGLIFVGGWGLRRWRRISQQTEAMLED